MRTLLLLLGLWLLLCPGRGLAQEFEAARIDWQGPPECPDAQAVRTVIERWLRESPDPVDASELYVGAHAQREPSQWTLDLALESPSGRSAERLQATECSTLVEAVGLKVASAATLLAELRALAEHPTRETVPATPPATVGISLRVAGGAAVGRLPGVSATLGLTGAVSWQRLRIELAIAYSPASTAYSEQTPAIGVKLQLASANVRACARLPAGALELPICGGVELGIMRGVGVGVEPLRSDQWFGEFVLGPALRWQFVPHMSVWIEVSAALAWLRPSYHVRAMNTLYRPVPASARTLAGLEVEF